MGEITMKTLARLTITLLLVSILSACTIPNLPKIALEDQKEIRKVRVVEKHSSITTDFSLPTGPVSGAFTRGLAGLGVGMLVGGSALLLAPHPFVLAGTAAVGGIVGLPLGIRMGIVCGSAVADAGIEDPAAHIDRIVNAVDAKQFTRAVEARLQDLRPGVLDSPAVTSDYTVLELQKVTVVINRLGNSSSSSCPPGLSGIAKWRARKSTDNTVLGDTTTEWSRPPTSQSFKDWLRNEDAMRMDIGLLLDELGVAVAVELLGGNLPAP